MANYTVKFYGTEDEKTTLECFKNRNNEIYIGIEEGNEFYPKSICLDISTAIKFAKVLRTEINKAKGGQNG